MHKLLLCFLQPVVIITCFREIITMDTSGFLTEISSNTILAYQAMYKVIVNHVSGGSACNRHSFIASVICIYGLMIHSVAKHCYFHLQQMWPLLKAGGGFGTQRDVAVVANLSARVGSIGDNRLGGWHSYRSSKAALNQRMILSLTFPSHFILSIFMALIYKHSLFLTTSIEQ